MRYNYCYYKFNIFLNMSEGIKEQAGSTAQWLKAFKLVMEDGPLNMRVNVAETIGTLPEGAQLEAFKMAMEDESDEVREAATWRIRELHRDIQRAALEIAMKDESTRVRKAAKEVYSLLRRSGI